MDNLELLFLSVEALKTNLVRTILTMLGVIIGIASVIVIVSLGQGTTQSIVGQFESFGANIITISPGRFGRGPGSFGGTVDTLSEKDVDSLKNLPNVIDVLGGVSTNKNIVNGSVSISNSISGVEANYYSLHELTLSQGAFITEGHVSARSKVLVLGDELVTDLFGEDMVVVGETVRVDGKTFRIIGVEENSSSAYAPISTVQKVLLSQNYLNSVEVFVTDSDLVESMESQIESTLLLNHDITNADNADFSIRNAQEIIDSISTATGTLTAMLSGIAAISLVVGGIGIMNIMLVTVTERTKEIGLLKAIGAKKKDILVQFLIESLVVTMLGGIAGITLGILVTFGISKVISVPFVISLSSILLALGVSASVGVIFGFYPAKKAADLHPIDALRYE